MGVENEFFIKDVLVCWSQNSSNNKHALLVDVRQPEWWDWLQLHSSLVDVYISSVKVVLSFNECTYMCVCVTVVLTTFAVYSFPRG